MAYGYNSGTSAQNRALVVSGLSGNVTISFRLLTNAPLSPRAGSWFFFDGRYISGDSYLYGFSDSWYGPSNVTNFMINGVPKSFDSDAKNAVINDVISFQVSASSVGSGFVLFNRFSVNNEVFENITITDFAITDGAGVHNIAFPSSGNSATDPLGMLTITIQNGDDSQWVFYSSGGGDSFAGTIGKTSLPILTKSLSTQLGLVIDGGKSSNTLSNKTLDVSSGYSSTLDKSTSTISQKQFSVSVGTVLGVGKQTLVLSNKQESTQLGYVNTLSKLGYTLATKQLSVVVGTNLPFTGVLNKTTYSLSGKQLDIVAGWNSGLNIQSLNVEGKQESANLGYVVDINELSIPVIGKPFSIQTGTSISFVGELSKSDLNLVGKSLSVDVGTVIPFIGLLGKTSLSLSGKALSRLNGQILDIQKQSISLVTKQLSIGEIIYPIIPVERLFTIKDKGRTFLFRQTTNIYLIKGK